MLRVVKITILSILLSFSVGFTTPVFASDIQISSDLGLEAVASKSKAGTSALSTRNESIPVLLGRIVGVLLSFIGVVFFILTIYAGIVWMIAHGNPALVTKAKDTLIASSVGLLIVLGAYAVTQFIFESIESDAPVAPVSDNQNNQQPS